MDAPACVQGKGSRKGTRVSGERPKGAARCRQQHSPASCQPPPPQTKVTIAGKNEIDNPEKLVGPFLAHKPSGPRPPPPPPPNTPPLSAALPVALVTCTPPPPGGPGTPPLNAKPHPPPIPSHRGPCAFSLGRAPAHLRAHEISAPVLRGPRPRSPAGPLHPRPPAWPRGAPQGPQQGTAHGHGGGRGGGGWRSVQQRTWAEGESAPWLSSSLAQWPRACRA